MRLANNNIAGNTLVSVMIFVIVLAIVMLPVIRYIELWKSHNSMDVTAGRLEKVNAAIHDYVTVNGRYPCPAAIDADFDSPAFGMEVSSDCLADAAAQPGTFRSTGAGDRTVRTGAVPVRTLGLPDEYIFDGYRHRYVYAVTETYTAAEPEVHKLKGAIRLVDGGGNVATGGEGNVVFAVIAMGDDINGAYTDAGALIQSCDESVVSGENCDFDATLKSTVNKSYVDDASKKFVHIVRYEASKSCINITKLPARVGFILDTSGSMDEPATCPPNYAPPCNRMDVAHWALRRAVASRQYQMKNIDPAFKTDVTGFVDQSNVSESQYEKRVDAFLKSGETVLDADENIETQLKKMCPEGGTPMGMHLEMLAKRIGGSGDKNNPNKIILISDGDSNVGVDPIDAVKELMKKNPTISVSVIDIGNSPNLKKITSLTGGEFLQTSDPDALLENLLRISGSCGTEDVPEPADGRYCPYNPPKPGACDLLPILCGIVDILTP